MPPPAAEQERQILARHLPAAAVDRIMDFIRQNRVHLNITRSRRTKLGDYSWAQRGRTFDRITVNGDLNPYRFLEVMLHEMGHHATYHQHGCRVQPHGREWQQAYARLLTAYCDCFPVEARAAVQRYASHIPLNAAAKEEMEDLLLRYDADYLPKEQKLLLDNLQPGTAFCLADDPRRRFRSVERRRTLWKCEEIGTGKLFLVRGAAEVRLL